MSNTQEKTSYYYVNNKRIPLIRDPQVRVVKYKQTRNQEIPQLSSSEARELLPDTSRMLYIPKYDLHVYQTKSDLDRGTSFNEISSKLQDVASKEENIEFVSAAYRQGSEDAELVFTTKRFTAQFKPELSKKDIDDIISEYNVKIVRKLVYAENAFELEAPEADGPNGPVALGNTFMETEKCLWAKASFLKQIHFRTVEMHEKNYLKQQWHLEVTKTFEAWEITKGNPKIKINICDDGIERRHPEFAGKIVGEYDFELNIADSSHKSPSDEHGTSCAGVASAKGIKASGAASGCSLIITRTPQRLADADEADMFAWAADNGADIISCSWGPPDRRSPSLPPSRPFPLPDETRAAIHYCVTKGRKGKGCSIFWAAGNGYGESVDDDGYASNPDVMAIGASTNPDSNGHEDKARYSDTGKAVFICAPSSGGTKSILTVDRLGKMGYNPRDRSTPDQVGNYTDVFGGTSSATPLVAGIAGLMLSVNPELTVDQVRDILRKTADKIGDKSTYTTDSSSNNNGLSHSKLYGYGRINGLAAVTEAQKLVNKLSTVSRSEEEEEEESDKNIDIPRTLIQSDDLVRQIDSSKWLSENL
jgi:subtilisin family serine protease